ncbi:hypothetical protein [Microbacterium elymi]|uniref:Uncharacterized protein n=1 Tax=Microbacterium elymi TaxID=2909587 RepID=A0ABY5NJ83_9MICO|nr:hypothetical protein [Microbacterium elymi]UUT35227.1 hypothetical protein L2X98_34015 [Microbacterium elymi]
MLALVHALHVLGGLNLALPALGRVRLRVLAHPARRYLVVQVVAQPVLFAGLVLAQAPVRDALPPAAVVLATAVCAVAVVVVLRVLAARR